MICNSGYAIELIWDGDSEIDGANVGGNLYYSICLRHLIRSRAVTNRIFFYPKRTILMHVCGKSSELPFSESTMELAGDNSCIKLPLP